MTKGTNDLARPTKVPFRRTVISVMAALILVGGPNIFGLPAAAATTESADLGMPFSGKWAYNVFVNPPYTDFNSSHPSAHKISGGADWATDLYGTSGQAVRLRIANPSGGVSFSWKSTSTSCGESTGVNVFVDGQFGVDLSSTFDRCCPQREHH